MNGFEIALDAHVVGHPYKSLGSELLHKIGGHIVVGCHKSPSEGYGRSVSSALRSPHVVADYKRLRLVDGNVTRCESFLHGQRIKERLESGTHLPLALHHLVVLEIIVIGSAYIRPHVSGLRLDCHESGPEERLEVLDGIVRSHDGVYVSLLVPGKYAHLGLLVKALLYLLISGSGLLHVLVPV